MVVTGVVTGVVTAALAHAHAVLLSTDPPADAQLSVGPTRVSATFNEQLQTTFAAMTVVGPDGNVWSAGEPQVQGAVISVGMRPLGPVGSYTVHYRVTSADGHVVSGTWSFRLTVPGAGTPGPSTHAPTTAGDRIPIWLFAGAAVLLVGAAAVWARRRS
ncbi:copper resistance CopC family protein [Mycobacterium sp.]|uniref:copper resistance CopC family protein n=1 Tax=Mycobacterium sp. TaxID=1785 RepID=UPI0025F6695C|nr:copper resistance CopC family protein [Mycobacterium sp.]